MDTLNVVEIGQDFLITAMWLSGPAIVVSLVVGLLISLAQTSHKRAGTNAVVCAANRCRRRGDAADAAVDAATVIRRLRCG